MSGARGVNGEACSDCLLSEQIGESELFVLVVVLGRKKGEP
ncbi:hypothetical protein VDG1235_4350 [Verrucomicrobiia bacterium DG1235]|nr:hypothetical protein VDG1235_4350 [Verrucomicrobiae bacterium DG1235]